MALLGSSEANLVPLVNYRTSLEISECPTSLGALFSLVGMVLRCKATGAGCETRRGRLDQLKAKKGEDKKRKLELALLSNARISRITGVLLSAFVALRMVRAARTPERAITKQRLVYALYSFVIHALNIKPL